MKKVHAIVAIFAVAIIIVVLLWSDSIIALFVPNNSQSQTTNTSYTELTLRHGNTTLIEFGDTEYSISYFSGSFLKVSTPLKSEFYQQLSEGKVFRDLGLEIKVSKMDSDYISEYIVILVKPTIQNYMASLFYTKVSLPLDSTRTVSISSGLIDKTNEYWFLYSQNVYPLATENKLTIGKGSQSETYNVAAGYTIKLFEIETRVYKVKSDYMVIYVKPLY